LSQSTEENVSFGGNFHGTFESITVIVTVWLGKAESK
jgi:hypothetical protein